jgi:hypothetical protein
MKPELSIPRFTRAEQETEAEANRMIQQIKNALAAVAVHSPDDVAVLEAAADRIERSARDLAFALRDLAHERSISRE